MRVLSSGSPMIALNSSRVNTTFIFFIFYFLPMSYCAQPKIVVHCSYGAKKYGFGSTNAVIFWYLVVLKIAIQFFSTTNTSALKASTLVVLNSYIAIFSTANTSKSCCNGGVIAKSF